MRLNSVPQRTMTHESCMPVVVAPQRLPTAGACEARTMPDGASGLAPTAGEQWRGQCRANGRSASVHVLVSLWHQHNNSGGAVAAQAGSARALSDFAGDSRLRAPSYPISKPVFSSGGGLAYTKYTCDKDQSRNKSMTGTRGAGMGVVFKQGSSAFVVCVQCRVVADTQILLIAKKLLGAAHRKRPWISVT